MNAYLAKICSKKFELIFEGSDLRLIKFMDARDSIMKGFSRLYILFYKRPNYVEFFSRRANKSQELRKGYT